MCDECNGKFTFILLAIIILVIVYITKKQKSTQKFTSIDEYPGNMSVDFPYKTLYTGAEVDPVITGGLYAYRDNLRPVYGARTADGDVWGLHEYCSSLPEVAGEQTLIDRHGKEVEYGDEMDSKLNVCYGDGCYDDGIPTNWNLPSTPFAWYKPARSDYYSKEGPMAYTKDIYAMSEPDHEPLLGSDLPPEKYNTVGRNKFTNQTIATSGIGRDLSPV